jgi:hypothetical protein
LTISVVWIHRFISPWSATVNSLAHKYLLVGCLFALVFVAPARAEPYVVEGIKLGAAINTAAPGYRSFKCAPSEQFEGYTRCQRTKPSVRATLSSTIIHASDGTAIYLAAKLAPVAMDRNAAQREIEELSREMKEQPRHVEWVPARAGSPAAVIAWWGRIELRQLKRAEVQDAADGYASGLLIDPLGDSPRAAKAGLPIYRIAGAAGYVYAASFAATPETGGDAPGRAHHGEASGARADRSGAVRFHVHAAAGTVVHGGTDRIPGFQLSACGRDGRARTQAPACPGR